MSKTIYFNLGTTFNYQVVKASGITQTGTNDDNNDKNIIINSNNFTKVSNAPTNVQYVWQKTEDSWFVFDGTDLWTLSNGSFTKTVVNMKENFVLIQKNIYYGIYFLILFQIQYFIMKNL